MGRTGTSIYVQYGKESTFKTFPTMTRAFGIGTQVPNVVANNNLGTLFGIGSVVAQKHYFGRFDGGLDVEFTLSTPWVLGCFLGVPVTAGAGPYTHTYSAATVAKDTISVELGGAYDTVNEVRKLLGGLGLQLGLSSSIGSPVNARAGFLYTQEDDPGTSLDSSIATDDLDFPYTFEHATIELPTSTTLGEVQAVDININPKPNLGFGHGSEFGVSPSWGSCEISGSITMNKKSSTQLQRQVGTGARAEVATMRVKFTNGLSGVNEKTIQFDFTGVAFGSITNSYRVDDVIQDVMPWVARNLSVVATNNITTPP